MKVYFLLLVILLAACGSGEENLPDVATEIFEGKEGIEIEFLEFSPPDKVTASYVPNPNEENPAITDPITNNFPVSLLIENRGAITVRQEDAYVNIITELEKMSVKPDPNTGESFPQNPQFNPQYINETLNGNLLLGKQHVLAGDKVLIQYDGETAALPKGTFNDQTNPEAIITAIACYKYETRLTTRTCIDTDRFRSQVTEREKTCIVEDEKFSNQGAPIAITKIEPNFVTVNQNGEPQLVPSFKVYVKNVGSGEVLHRERIEDACQYRSEPSENVLDCTATPDDPRCECGGYGPRTLECTGHRTPSCTLRNVTNKFGEIEEVPICICIDTCLTEEERTAAEEDIEKKKAEAEENGEEYIEPKLPEANCNPDPVTSHVICQDNQIYNKDLERCVTNELLCSNPQFNIVHAVGATIGSRQFECEGNLGTGILKLTRNDENNFFNCRLQNRQEDAFSTDVRSYVTEFNIVLEYGYTTSISKTIEIERFI